MFRFAFSKNRKPTIIRKDNPNGPLGQPFVGGKLSSIDQGQLNAMYCDSIVTTPGKLIP